MNKYIIKLALGLGLLQWSCGPSLPEIKADVITEKTGYDSDDPAIWINPNNPAQSIVFGTDKDTDGAIYAFDLDGKIIEDKTIKGIKRPNNVDLAYGFRVNDSVQKDVIVFTERELQQIRMFSVPDMQPIDNGGFKVFEDANLSEIPESNLPMGVALYTSPKTQDLYAIVSRKTGPKENYLYQYKLKTDSLGVVQSKLVRRFGNFSGIKEIEAIAVDNEAGIVYYSDEDHCVRKYYAEPSMGNEELACFGAEYFKEDIEGIAIVKYKSKGFLVISNQTAHTFNIFDLETLEFVKEINLGTTETDGCDVTTVALGDKFPNGLFVSMNDDKTFFFHDLKKLELQ